MSRGTPVEKLTERKAFEAMVLFLEGFYERTQSDDVGGLLSDLMMLEDGTTADPAAWDDWMECVWKVLVVTQKD
jgi:hypothetical protein